MAFVIIPVSVLCQAFFRCGFVKLYHKVETVIEESIKTHEEEEEERTEILRKRKRRENNNNNNNSNSNNNSSDEDEEEREAQGTKQVSESALLRLELNDVSCSIAAGVGFGAMHIVLLYGTLLASENGRNGTLYQPSCAIMPSLANSAIMAFWFSILDVVWMMVAFYGVRVWEGHVQYRSQQSTGATASLTPSGQQQQQQQQRQLQSQSSQQAILTAYNHGAAIIDEWSFAKGRVSGKAALLFMVLTHLGASASTTFNAMIPANGCVIALPMLSFVSLVIIATTWVFLKDNFLPEGQKQRIRQANHLD